MYGVRGSSSGKYTDQVTTGTTRPPTRLTHPPSHFRHCPPSPLPDTVANCRVSSMSCAGLAHAAEWVHSWPCILSEIRRQLWLVGSIFLFSFFFFLKKIMGLERAGGYRRDWPIKTVYLCWLVHWSVRTGWTFCLLCCTEYILRTCMHTEYGVYGVVLGWWMGGDMIASSWDGQGLFG